MKISIIGTSGRPVKDAPEKILTSQLFENMIRVTRSFIVGMGYNKNNATLISGGAAWADHVAVMLFLKYKEEFKGLKLYIPCPFDYEAEKFYDTGVVDWRVNPGGTLNYYHRLFSEKLGRNTLLDIKQAIDNGAEIDYSHKSFHQRNSEVAKSNIVIALTWGKEEPVDGGTLDTWKKVPSASTKKHISLTYL